MMPPWLIALLVTLMAEVPLVTALYPGQRPRMAAVAMAANLATNLTLNLVLPRLSFLRGHYLVPGEAMAVAVEATAYALASRPRDLARGLMVSSLANALSFSLGLTPILHSLLAPAGPFLAPKA